MIWLFWAWLIYSAGMHDTGITYDDIGWGLRARIFHGAWRGIVLLAFIYCALRGFTQIGVLS